MKKAHKTVEEFAQEFGTYLASLFENVRLYLIKTTRAGQILDHKVHHLEAAGL